MKIGLIGGTFNPVHYGHLILSEYVRDYCKLDKIIFIPTGLSPHKLSNTVIHPKIRFHMTKLAIDSNKYFSLTDIETCKTGISYTIDTIREMKKIYKNQELYFIIGADSLFQLPTWNHYEKLIQETNIIVVNRPGGKNHLIQEKINEYKELFGGNIIQVKTPLIDISSSNIRDRVKNGRSIKYLLPENVEDYILQKGLYKDGNEIGF